MLEIKNLKKVYGKDKSTFTALDNINLSIGNGESLAIIGKSGSGKSTLMHIMAGLDKPTEGKIFLDEVDLSSLSRVELAEVRNRKFGFIFQQFFLLAKSTVLENVILPLKIAGMSGEESRVLGRKALEEVELLDKANNLASDLSGGQKQRVAIARAIITNPSVIFADEPTGNLDSTTGSSIEKLLFKLNKEKNITLVLVTHDTDLADKCDRKVQIKDGNLI